MPKIRLLVEGPYPYSDGVYHFGDEFEVGEVAFAAMVKSGDGEAVEEVDVELAGGGEAGEEEDGEEGRE